MANGVNALGFFNEFSSREDEEVLDDLEWHKKIAVPVQWYVSCWIQSQQFPNNFSHPHKN
jgi:hypothetical protein